MSIEKFQLDQEKKLRIKKILTNLLNTVSYRSKERSILIDVTVADIFSRDTKQLWLSDLDEFLEKNTRTCLKTYSKYYYKDIYERLYNEFYLSEYEKDLDLFAIKVRKFKLESKSLLSTKKPIKVYFKEKRNKKSKKSRI